MQESQEMWVLSLGWEDSLEEEMATQSSLLCLENPIDRGAWQASSWGHKESEQLSTSLFLAALSLCWCTWAFLSCGNPGLLFIVVGELHITGASPAVA